MSQQSAEEVQPYRLVNKHGNPSDVERWLSYKLPREVYGIQARPCDADGRKCPAWRASFYEIKARLVHTPKAAELDPVEDALKAIEGVTRTTRELPDNGAADPDWPAKRRTYKDGNPWTTPGVLAILTP